MLSNYHLAQKRSNPEAQVIGAAKSRQWHDVRRLLDNGADVNVVDTTGRSILWLVSAYADDEDLIIKIIDTGADLNISALLAGEPFSISVTQLLKKRGFLKAYNKIISAQSSKIVAYVHLSYDYVGNHIGVTFFDHNLDYGIEIDPYNDDYTKSIRRSTLIRRLTQSYSAFAFRAEIKSLAFLLNLSEDLKKRNKFNSPFENCADLVRHLVPKHATERDIVTCDFLTHCMPLLPSIFDCITNPNHVFKQVYANVKNNLLFEHNVTWYTSRLSIGDVLRYVPFFMPKTSKDFENEIKALECRISASNYNESQSVTTKLKVY